MENNKSAEEELKIKLEESLQETLVGQEIENVLDGIQDIIDDCCLSPLEILGILDIIRHNMHVQMEDMCKDCIKNRS